MNIGVLGGTFNPIHNGHLYLAREACKEIPLDRLIWVPTGVSPFKTEEELLDVEMRYEMVRLAVGGEPGWEVSDLEFKKDRPSYTVDTLEELRKRFPAPEHTLYLIIGSDHLAHFPEWKEASRILRLAEVVAMTRPGFSLRAARGPMRLIPTAGVNVASSKIRKEIKAGGPIEKWVPAPVAEYIQKKGLYR